MIAIVDYGLGNIANVMNALHYLGYEVEVTKDTGKLRAASHILLPGVGHFKDAMEAIERQGLVPILKELRQTHPMVGICLGMQLLFEHSEEGDAKGLSFLPGKVELIRSELPVPHLGWNTLISDHPLLTEDVYFIHSYKVVTKENVVATADYGQEIVAIVQKDSLIGIQFHPEKSGEAGLAILDQALKGGFL
jgi:glutamine amidotransferase